MVQMLSARYVIANRVPLAAIDLTFRIASAAVLSRAGRYRFLVGGISPRQLAATLARIRAVRSWPVVWVRTARSYLAQARDRQRSGDLAIAAEQQRSAALCYHFAQIFELENLERRRRLYRRAASLFREVAPHLAPPAYPVEVNWRGTPLPGYLRLPESPSRPYPLVVLLNGSSTVKEETIGWATPFLQRGLAVLALDTPGSGEAWDLALAAPGQEDIAEAILDFTSSTPELDPRRVSLLGVSLRGAMAVQLASYLPQLAAVVAVTPPYDPAPYLPYLHPLVRQDVAWTIGVAPADLPNLASHISLVEPVRALRVPLMVVGAGADLVVPPAEALRLYRAATSPKYLLFLDDANHVAFTHLEHWTAAAADWLAGTLAGR
ncbi:2,6-dihydropseudooxynicotine hydrolase [bacterium HR26]|nr:2,6-dihydropseudooxynicotine hydrolase [bacterium HR26]